jgi:hypothetical protein
VGLRRASVLRQLGPPAQRVTPACPPCFTPGAPCPGRSHRMPTRSHLPEVNRPAEPAAPPPFIPVNNRVEADHGRLKERLRPMPGLKTNRSLRTIAAGHAFVQNLRRGHYEHCTDPPIQDRVRTAFTNLALCL